MKKYLYILSIIAIGFLTSCNEDIPIDEIKQSFEVTFQLNPETVVEPFEYTRYYLERLDYASLRLRLYVYDEEGQLVASEEGLVSSYLDKTMLSVNLKEGNYKAIVISNVRLNNGAYEYWTITGEQKLNTLTMTKDNNTRWDFAYNLVGFACKQIIVNKNNTANLMELKPASSLFVVHYEHIHAYNNITQLRFTGGKREKSIMNFDTDVNPLYSFDITENYNTYYVLDYVDIDDFEYENDENDYVNSYLCILPMNEFNMLFFCTQNGESRYFNNHLSLSNMESGKEYYAYLDLSDDEGQFYAECGRLIDIMSANTNTSSCQSLKTCKSLIKSDLSVNQPRSSLMIKDLIK